MEPYLVLLIAILITVSLRGLKEQNIVAFLIWGAMMLLCGMRGREVGVDTSHYYDSFVHGSERMEPMFKGITLLCHKMEWPYGALLFIYAIFTYIPLGYYMQRKSVNLSFSILIFLSFSVYFYHETFNTMRVYAAISYSTLAIVFYEERKYVKTILFLLLGIMFHYSTIVVVPLMFFARYVGQIKYWQMIAGVVLSFIFGFAVITGFSSEAHELSTLVDLYFEDDVASYYQNHLNDLNETSFNLIGTLSTMLPFSAFAFLMYDKENASRLDYKLFLFAVIIQNVFISIELTYRVTMFFLVFLVCVLPNSCARAKGLRYNCLLLLNALMVMWYVYRLFSAASGDLAGTVPYSFE